MKTNNMEPNTIFGSIIGSGVTLLLAKFIFTTQVKRIDDVEKEASEIKSNYISQFKEVKDLINELKIDIARLEERLPKKRNERQR